MPRLTVNQMKVLNDHVNATPGKSWIEYELPHHDKDEVSCWKWALFGLANNVTMNGKNNSVNIHRPGEFFSAITNGVQIDPNSFWNNYIGNIKEENAVVKNFNPDARHSASDWEAWRYWRQRVMTFACTTFCTQMGFIAPNTLTDYTLVMHYYDAPDKGTPYGPNETHWWIEVPLQNNNFVCIETFPQDTNPPTLQFRFNERYSEDKIIKVPINNLFPSHISAIPF